MSDQDHPNVVIFPPKLFAIALVVGLLLHVLSPLRFRITWLRWLGGALALASLAFARWGKRIMERGGTNVRPDMPSLAIVDGGPFGYTRNPLYLAVLGMFLGVGLALASPAFLIMVIPVALILRYGVIAREEIYLEKKFGDAYLAYKRRVRRWL